jgi:hypothetical protein
MVSEKQLALNPVDRLMAGYMIFVTLVILFQGDIFTVPNIGMLSMHALFGVLLFLFTKLREGDTAGRFCHDLYPLLFLVPFYTEFGFINPPPGTQSVLDHDLIVQRWEEAIFGAQVSYTWIRNAPSVFWSGVLHAAYMTYYFIILAPLVIWLVGGRKESRQLILPTMIAFVSCYVVFILWPVAGPYYAFDQPTGPVREVWSARLVYGMLGDNSSFGTAFPSSHVSATVAANLAQWRYARKTGIGLFVPSFLLVTGTVYCQMHYGVDATAGIIVGVIGFWVGVKIRA